MVTAPVRLPVKGGWDGGDIRERNSRAGKEEIPGTVMERWRKVA